MAKTDINQLVCVSNHHPRLSSPLPSRRLSLKRSTQIRNKPCYREEDDFPDPGSPPPRKRFPATSSSSATVITEIDLSKDENLSLSHDSSSSSSSPASENVDLDNHARLLGLPNCGNTCFVNSILQVLRYTPNFVFSIHTLLAAHHFRAKGSLNEENTDEIAFFKHMHNLYGVMKRKEKLMKKNDNKNYKSYLLKPVNTLINSLREMTTLFEEGEQHDAHEFLLALISAFQSAVQSLKSTNEDSDEDSNEVVVPDSPDPAQVSVTIETICEAFMSAGTDLKSQMVTGRLKRPRNRSFDFGVLQNLRLGFEGKIRHVVKCDECELRSENEENVTNLDVKITEDESKQDTVELAQCLSQTTKMVDENKFFCSQCLRHNEATASSELISAPEILLLHVNCHISSTMTNTEKARIKVIIPLNLKTSENRDFFRCTHHEYKLYAIVLHIGRSALGGHYVSFIKDASQTNTIDSPLRQRVLLKTSNPFTSAPETCCLTDEIVKFSMLESSNKWLLFDDEKVNFVTIDQDLESFPYFDYLNVTASPSLIFYHRM